MRREPVVSSNIKAVGHDEKTSILEVEFNSGSVYQYTGVPKEVYTALVSAASVGKYFGASVKGVYPFEKISG
jgi:hypothetical protein